MRGARLRRAARAVAEAYLRESVLEPSAYVVSGARYAGAPGVSLMPAQYADLLTQAEQIDDLVAYLSTLR